MSVPPISLWGTLAAWTGHSRRDQQDAVLRCSYWHTRRDGVFSVGTSDVALLRTALPSCTIRIREH